MEEKEGGGAGGNRDEGKKNVEEIGEEMIRENIGKGKCERWKL